jgi:hypothetical protein
VIQRIVFPKDQIIQRGAILTVCDGNACIKMKVESVSGSAIDLIEVAGSCAKDPALAYFNKLVDAGALRKVARQRACKKFKISRRAFFYRQRGR